MKSPCCQFIVYTDTLDGKKYCARCLRPVNPIKPERSFIDADDDVYTAGEDRDELG